MINNAVKKFFPNVEISNIINNSAYGENTFLIYFENKESILLKIEDDLVHSNLKKEIKATEFLNNNGLNLPKIFFYDDSGDILPLPYIIEEEREGIKLYDLLQGKKEILDIYETVGSFYGKMHSIKEDARKKDNVVDIASPYDYFYNSEVAGGSCKLAFEKDLIGKKDYDTLLYLWKNNIKYLQDGSFSYIHGSAFLWNIYLSKKNGSWEVCRLGNLKDARWFDPAFDEALILYPYFSIEDESIFRAFFKGYGSMPDRKRITLFLMVQVLSEAVRSLDIPNRYFDIVQIKNSIFKLKLLLRKIK